MHHYDLSLEDRKKIRYGLHGVKLNIDFDKIYEMCRPNLGAGNRGKVYILKDTNTCIKILKDDASVNESGYLTEPRKHIKKMLIKIKNLDLKNVYKIVDITFMHKFRLSKMQGYIMKYYEDDKQSILYRDCNWFKKQYNQLFHDYTVLAENRISFIDDNPNNYCVSDDIILIDMDNFEFVSPFKIKSLIETNQSRAYTAIIMLINDAIDEYKVNNRIRELDRGILDSFRKDALNKGTPEMLFELLDEYGTVMEYLKSLNNIKSK